MKIAFPVKENNGLASILDEHFGIAGRFLIVDTDTREYVHRENQKLSAKTSRCKTSIFRKEDKVDAVVTKCMGDGSRRSLEGLGIKIFQAAENRVDKNLELLINNELKLFHIFDICQTKRNKKDGHCGHHH